MDPRILELFETRLDYLRQLAYGVTGNRHDADDAVGNAARKLCGMSASDVSNIPAFLATVVQHAARDIVRKRKRETPSPDVDPPSPYPSPSAGEVDLDDGDAARRSDELLREAMERLSDEHRQVIETLLACENDPSRALDELVEQAGAGKDARAVRNTQKVRLKAARERLFLLFRLAKMARGCEKTFHALCQLMLQGDEHYDDVQWGLRRDPRRDYPGRARLAGLVRLGSWIHRAARQADDAGERQRLHDALQRREQSFARLCYKYGNPTLRRNGTVQVYFAATDPACTLESVRKDFYGSHVCVLQAKLHATGE